MLNNKNLVALGCYLAAAALPAQAGETYGTLAMSLTIHPSCEISNHLDNGNFKVKDVGCSGNSAFRVDSEQISPRNIVASTQVAALDRSRGGQRIVTIYW